MTDNPTHPMSAPDLRYWLTFLTLECRPRMWGDSTPEQYCTIPQYLDRVFEGKRKDKQRQRLDVLEYIFGRRFVSTKGITKAEGSAIMHWLKTTSPAALAVECERCLVAYRIESGQMVIPELEVSK